MNYLLALLCALFLCACAGPEKNSQALPALANIADHADLACRYEKKLTDEKNLRQSNWYFWRQSQRTDTRDELSNQGEIWERTPAGQLFYTRLFYNERIALEFTPGDLQATGTAASWPQIRSIIDPSVLSKQLPLSATATVNGELVEYYRGVLNGVNTEIDWLPRLQLPARIAKKQPEGLFQLTLLGCDELTAAANQPIDKAKLEQFRHVDYTDIGDMESDPVIHRLEQFITGHHEGH